MKICIFFILFFSFFLKLDAQKIIDIRIDPNNATGGTAMHVFDSIKYIPLETTKESLFANIDQLEVDDDYFFINDMSQRSILIFYQNGNFYKRIRTGAQNKFFGYFTLDREHKQIIADNNFSGDLLVYDYNGNLVTHFPCPKNIGSVYRFPNDTYVYRLERPGDPKEKAEIPFDIAYSKGPNKIVKYSNGYNAAFQDGRYNTPDNPLSYSGQQNSCMFSVPFDYNVFELSDTGIINQYQFIFPMQYSLPKNFSTDSSLGGGKRADMVYSNREWANKIHAISGLHHVDDYLLFYGETSHIVFGNDWNYLYNLKHKTLLSFSKVSADSSSFYFPLLGSVYETIECIHDKKIYSAFPAFRLFSFKDANGHAIKYPEALEKLFISGSKNSNPILVEMELKKNL